MSQKATLKKWLKTNESYFHSNPEMLKSIMNDPAFLVRFNQLISNRKSRLERKLAKVESRRRVATNVHASARTRKGLPSLKLPSLSSMSERLNDVNEMIGFIRELTRK